MRSKNFHRFIAALAFVGFVPFLAGCPKQPVRAAAPAYIVPGDTLAQLERPMNAAPDTDALPPVAQLSAPPAVPLTAMLPEGAGGIPTHRAAPPPPRPVPEQPPVEANARPSTNPPAPQITPQLSVDDQAGYQRKANEDISVAQNNLQSADGRHLNASQQDLVEKIRSFVAQSREASRDGDWTRAQNLSQKARSLSVELMNSL